MSFTQTPNYGLYKPTINSDNDQWGSHLNLNSDTLDTTLATFATPASVAAAVAPYANDVGRNLIHNPLFNVAQRGASFPSPFAGAYTLDRWWFGTSLDVSGLVQQSLADADRTAIGDGAATVCFSTSFTGNAGAASFTVAFQPIEGVRRLAGKTVTVSFWANASTALKLGVSFDQIFGNTGSPSATVTGNGQSVTLTAAWTRYSLTFALPAATGKTLTTGDSTAMYFWFSSGATNATRAGSVGVQSGAVNIWGVQLEIGSVATPLEKPDPQQDLAKCQRFYQGGALYLVGYGAAGTAIGSIFSFSGTMRSATPTIVFTPSGNNNVGAVTTQNQGYGQFLFYALATGSVGGTQIQGNWTASADL